MATFANNFSNLHETATFLERRNSLKIHSRRNKMNHSITTIEIEGLNGFSGNFCPEKGKDTNFFPSFWPV